MLNITPFSLHSIKSDFIEKPAINSLLQYGRADEIADYAQAHFAKLMEYLETLDNTDVQANGLTRREEMLIKLGGSIQNCDTGKKEGIQDAYDVYLPPEYRLEKLQKTEGESEEVHEAKQYLFVFLQKLLNSLIMAETPLMRDLADAQSLRYQLAHQSLYLQNLIGHRIGLVHRVAFDSYTSAISDKLLKRGLKETLEIFYAHFTPSFLVRELKAHIDRSDLWKINATKKEKYIRTGLHTLGNEALHTPWEVDEDDIPTTGKVTLEGALHILETLGLLEPRSRTRPLDKLLIRDFAWHRGVVV